MGPKFNDHTDQRSRIKDRTPYLNGFRRASASLSASSTLDRRRLTGAFDFFFDDVDNCAGVCFFDGGGVWKRGFID